MFETDLVFENSQREEALHSELQEVCFAKACSIQAQQEPQYWEQQKKTNLQACLRTAELRLCQEAARHRHDVEIASLQFHHQLKGELQEAEISYRQLVRLRPNTFAKNWIFRSLLLLKLNPCLLNAKKVIRTPTAKRSAGNQLLT